MIFPRAGSEQAVFDADSAQWYSYGNLATDVERVAALFQARAKSLVFCFCRNDYESLCGYLGAVQSLHACALLDDTMHAGARTALIDLYAPDFIVQSSRGQSIAVAPEYKPAASSAGPLVWCRSERSETHIHEALSVLLSTSGTTGSPKFVRLSRNNLLANAQSICQGLGIRESDRAITSLPFHYSYGLSVVNTHLLQGASLVLSNDNLMTGAFWNTFRDLSCSSIAGVPYSYQLMNRLGLPGNDCPSLKTMTQAGGKLQPDLILSFHKRMTERGGRFFVMYGQTEAAARIAILDPAWLPEKLGSAGQAIPGGTLSVWSESSPLPAGEQGELVYSGPNVMLGYASTRSDLSLGDELQSVLHTGDRGYIDTDGFIFVTGRLNRYAKLSGRRLNLDDVEAMLKDHGPCAVIAMENQLAIFHEIEQETAVARCRQELAQKLSVHPSLLHFRAVSRLPLKSNGKVDYNTLEKAVQC